MIVIPAIDLRGGRTVRMEQGDPSREKIFDGDPVDRAKAFVAAGAQRLHVIDLDNAFGRGENHTAIGNICRAVDVPVQVGGGIRSLEHAQARLEAGASYVILGTLLINEERIARNIIGKLGEKVIAAVDARGREVMSHGWQERTPVDRNALIKRVVSWGITRVIFTEIAHDGMGRGFDIDALRDIATLADVKITASGGARGVDDLKALKAKAPASVDSCVVGSALYEGTIDLTQAISALT